MNATPNEFVTNACKGNVDCGLRVVEALVEGATRIHELQLEAATEAHAGAVATQKCVAQTTDPVKIVQLYSEWMLANAQKSAAYWQSIGQAMMETNAAILKSLGDGAGNAAPVGGLDEAYKRWSDMTRGFYGMATSMPALFKPQEKVKS